MTDKLRADFERGERAKRILESDLFNEALETIRGNLQKEWANSKSGDKEGREEAWRMLKVTNEFERFFINVVATGKMAGQEISRLQQIGQKVKSLWK